MDPRKVLLVIVIVFGVIFSIVAMSSMFITIEAGHRGVLFRPFGGGIQVDESYQPGFQVIAPWNTMYVYDVRLQEQAEMMDVLSNNGLSIKVDISVRYKPMDEMIGYIHNTVGSDFLAKIIIPEVRSATRKVIGKYTPEQLYSSKREVIQSEIIESTKDILNKNHLLLDAILIRSVELPLTIREAIERKLKQEQESQEYAFRIEKETKEAERKRIEAKGIQDFQTIVSEGISDKLLKWKGIEATQDLAKSPNAKVVVIGSGKDGLPIILGGDK
jgi:prohibitin 1